MNRAYAKLNQAMSTTLNLWHSPPWQAGFYAEARGHSLRHRIGRLLEPQFPQDRIMKRALIAAASLLCLIASGVRFELVAQEAEPVTDAKTAPNAVVEGPVVPKVAREELRYDGKSFEEWQRMFQTELKLERRTEAVWAMYVFVQNGYADEAAETIVAVLANLRPPAQRNSDQFFKQAIEATLAQTDPKVVIPLLVDVLQDSMNPDAERVALLTLQHEGLREQVDVDAIWPQRA